MPLIRVAQAQINSTVGDFAGNSIKIIKIIKKAIEKEAHIVIFPELCVCGYPPEDLLLRPGFLKDNLQAVRQLIEHTRGIAVVVGFADYCDGNVYNAAAILQNQEFSATYHKIELPNYGVFDEQRYFVKGSGPSILEINRIPLTLTICEDIWIEGGMAEKYAVSKGVDMVINISASPFHAGKLHTRLEVAGRFARNTDAYLCFNNLVGGQDELVFDGGSFVMSPEGRPMSWAKRFQEELLITEIDIGAGKRIKTGGPGESQKNPAPLEPDSGKPEEGPFHDMVGEYSRLDEVYQALLLGTRDYVSKNGFKKVLIGLSGGIDSSLTAVIAVDALGAENVVGVTMPSQFTSQETFSDSERLAENLGIQLLTVPIKGVYESYLFAIRDSLDIRGHGVTQENIQARIRGNILMAISNQFGWLVLTTGNKSEIAVGYCTLYGDMAGGFAVIKDVPKTLVFELSEYVNDIRGKEIIPRSVIERPPSAELRPDQKDEDTLPPYSMLDTILQAYVEEDKAPDEIVEAGFDRKIVNEVVRMVDLNEYKRRQAAPGVKITPKAFGRDRRLPITNAYLRRFK